MQQAGASWSEMGISLPSPPILGSLDPPLPSLPSPPQCFPSTPDPWKEGCLSCLRNSLPLPYLSSSLDLQVANGIGELFSPLTWIACPSMTEWGGIREGGINIYLETTHLMTVCLNSQRKKSRLRRINH